MENTEVSPTRPVIIDQTSELGTFFPLYQRGLSAICFRNTAKGKTEIHNVEGCTRTQLIAALKELGYPVVN